MEPEVLTLDSETDYGLEGKVAIVTGGGAAGDGIGNGRAAAILLARAGAYDDVIELIHYSRVFRPRICVTRT